jgi:hypothetical protein
LRRRTLQLTAVVLLNLLGGDQRVDLAMSAIEAV